jgi:DNA-directed RNA polymerase subunit K/omega
MPVNFKGSDAARTSITRNTVELEESTGNIYESVVIISKRSNQINAELKEELTRKLEEFASTTDNLEEIFENREQIEISRYYEKLPKPNAIAIKELLDNKIYFRNPDEEEAEKEIKEEEK